MNTCNRGWPQCWQLVVSAILKECNGVPCVTANVDTITHDGCSSRSYAPFRHGCCHAHTGGGHVDAYASQDISGVFVGSKKLKLLQVSSSLKPLPDLIGDVCAQARMRTCTHVRQHPCSQPCHRNLAAAAIHACSPPCSKVADYSTCTNSSASKA